MNEDNMLTLTSGLKSKRSRQVTEHDLLFDLDVDRLRWSVKCLAENGPMLRKVL
jgi:hypothetical protein